MQGEGDFVRSSSKCLKQCSSSAILFYQFVRLACISHSTSCHLVRHAPFEWCAKSSNSELFVYCFAWCKHVSIKIRWVRKWSESGVCEHALKCGIYDSINSSSMMDFMFPCRFSSRDFSFHVLSVAATHKNHLFPFHFSPSSSLGFFFLKKEEKKQNTSGKKCDVKFSNQSTYLHDSNCPT